ncbi:DUF4426 domain-containing protein [Aliikangiella sp. IMCC44653]
MKLHLHILAKLSQLLLMLGLLGLPFSSPAANEFKINDVTIYYSAVNTSLIPPSVAAQYGIKRSGRIGLVNIAVKKNDQAVIANIFGHGKNLTGQLKELAFKEIKEDKAIYYIATYTFNNAEKVTFDLQIQPEKNGRLIPLQFKQALYIERAE